MVNTQFSVFWLLLLFTTQIFFVEFGGVVENLLVVDYHYNQTIKQLKYGA